MEAGNPLLDDYVLALAGGEGPARRERPRVCFLPSASGDADHYIVRFYRAFDSSRCEPSHISLFRRDHGAAGFREHLLSQDLIYVGGGSVLSLLGVWAAHGIDEILREAYASGVVLCGVSAGSLCWFEEGVTAFHGEPRAYSGLGLLPWSNTVHYDAGRGRADEYRRRLLEGMRPGFAAEDGTALHFVGERLHRVVSSRPARARLPDASRGERPGGEEGAAACVPRRGGHGTDGGAGALAEDRARARRRRRAVSAGPTRRRILALGGGGFTTSVEDVALDEYVVELASRARPRLCLLPTASGDPQAEIDRFYSAFGPLGCELSHVSLFRLGSRPLDLGRHLLSQDAIYVGGGSMLNLLALWRLHGVDSLLREAWQQGVILCGVSAGALCWFEAGITRTRGRPAPATGLGLLPGSISVHDSTDPARRAEYRARVAAGMPGGWAVEDGVALLFEGSRMRCAVSSRAAAPRPPGRAGGNAPGGAAARARLLSAGATAPPPEAGAILEFREAAQRRSRPSRNSLRSIPPV